MAAVIISTEVCSELYAAQASSFQSMRIGLTGVLPVTADTASSYAQEAHLERMAPWWVSRDRQDASFTGVLLVDPDLPVFAGHFPDNPLLPGVVQIDWAVSATAESFPDLPASAFIGMSRIKFKAPVKPGCWLSLQLVRKDSHVSFTYVSPHDGQDSICTEGRLQYRD